MPYDRFDIASQRSASTLPRASHRRAVGEVLETASGRRAIRHHGKCMLSNIPLAVRRLATTNERFTSVINIFGIWLSPVLLGLSGAFLLRPDANWDLANYHYYNAWAFLNGRTGEDI